MSKTQTIGLITRSFGGIFHTPFIQVLHEQLRNRGYRLLVIQGTIADVITERLAVERVDGWITINTGEQAAALRSLGKPVLLISSSCADVPCVVPDNRSGTIAAIEHLITQGCRKIAFIGYFINPDFRERYAAFEEALQLHGMTVEPHRVIDPGSYNVHSTYQTFRSVLQSGCDLDAVFGANDWHAFGAIQALTEAGRRIPQDVAVIGFDDVPDAQFAIPALTSIRQNPAQFGLVAAQLMLDQIEHQIAPPLITRLPTELIIRKSSTIVGTTFASVQASHQYQDGNWQERLVQDLVQKLLDLDQSNQARPAEQVWPGVEILVANLDATIRGLPNQELPANFWDIGLHTMRSETRLQLIELLSIAGRQRLVATGSLANHGAVERLIPWLLDCKEQIDYPYLMMQVNQAEQDRQRYMAESVLLSRVGSAGNSPRIMDWMSESFADWSVLGLWDNIQSYKPHTLKITSQYIREQGALVSDVSITPERFPPMEMLPRAIDRSLEYLIKLCPVVSSERNWGYMAYAERFYWTLNDIVINRNTFLATALELEQQAFELQELSIRDSLTGLHNRRYLAKMAPTVIDQLKHHQHVPALAIADIDNFKQINDTFSHDGGDKVLVTFANILRENHRTSDSAIRLGGEEFALFLPDASRASLQYICERVRMAVEQFDWDSVASGLRVTISIGAAIAQIGDTLQTLLHRADICLYMAKRAGKNRVVSDETFTDNDPTIEKDQ